MCQEGCSIPPRKTAPGGHQKWDPFHIPHGPCVISSLTLPSSTDTHAYQTCSNFALLRHLARQEVKPNWVRRHCGWLDAISPQLETGTVQEQGCNGATGAPRGQAGQSGTKEEALSQCQPCKTDFLGNVHIVTHGTPDRANTGHIASLHSASWLWQVKFLGSFYKMFYKYKLPYKTKMLLSLL